MRRAQVITGVLLVLIGGWQILQAYDIIPPLKTTWPFVVVLIGIVLLLLALLSRNSKE